MINKICKSFIFTITIFFIINVKANSIEKIDMDVYIDSNGNASITETWHANLSQGTEGYRIYSKLDGSEMYNLMVTDESGKEYQILKTWNSNDSFANKAYKAALVSKGTDSELCFGISSYGNKVYTIKYNVSNIVRKYSDVEGIYYSFLQMDMRVNDVKIVIHSDIPFSLNNTRIWGLGYSGEIVFDNGNIILTTSGVLNPANRMVALVRFNDNIFKTSLTIGKSFDDIYDEAFSDVKKQSSNVMSDATAITLVIIFFGLLVFLPWLLPVLVIFVAKAIVNKLTFKNYSKGNHGKYLDFGKNGKKLSKEVPYWREIPCYKNINYAYWLCDEFYLIKPEILNKGIVGAYLLKWVKNDNIKIIKEKNKYMIDISSKFEISDNIERAIYYIIEKAAGENKILEPKELKKWAKKNYKAIYNLGNDINSYIIDYLITKGDMVRNSNKAFDIIINDSIKEEAIKLKGFIKYLNDFSSISEKEYIDVKLWDEYLIFAELFGVADKVRKEFKKLYPNIEDIDKVAMLDKIGIFESVISDISSACINGAKSGYNKYYISSTFNRISGSGGHDYSGSNSSSGGGGSSSSSGGGSSGGSSGGGFR